MMKTFEFYVFYFIIVVFLLFVSFKLRDHNKTISNILAFLSFLIYIYVAVNRPIEKNFFNGNLQVFGGADAYTYRNYFYAANIPFFDYIKNYNGEIGFNFFLWIIFQIFADFKVFLFIFHSIIFYLFYWNVKNQIVNTLKYKFYYILLFSIFIFTSFNTMRNDLATLIWMISFYYLKRSEYFKSSLLLIIASSIHYASLIGFPVIVLHYLYQSLKLSNKTKIYFGIPLCIIAFYIITKILVTSYFVNSDYNVYLNDDGLAINTYMYILMFIIIAIIKDKEIKDKIQSSNAYLISLIVSFSIISIQNQFFMAYRMLLMFLGINYIYSFELIEKVLKKNNYINLFFKMLIYIFYIYRIYDLFFVEISVSGLVRI